MRLILLIFLLCLASCKTKQKSSSGSAEADYKLKTETKVDSASIAKVTVEVEEEQYTEIEQITTKYVAIDSSGVTILKPEVITYKASTGKRKKNKTMSDVTTDLKSDKKVDLDSLGKNEYKADDEKKPVDVVGSLAGVLFPSWLKIAGLVIGLISTAIITRVYIKKAHKKSLSD